MGSESEAGELIEGATNEVRINRLDDGRIIVTKCYREARHYRQERAALLDWAPRLPFATPRLLEDRGEEARTLVLAGLPGLVPDEEAMNSVKLHRCAGAVLAALHSLDHVDSDRVAPREALCMRLESLLEGSADHLEDDFRRRGERCLENVRELEWPSGRVPCHRDFEPRNWVQGPRGFGLIDFEQARPDLAEVDLVKLHLGAWLGRPDLSAAFFDGYGRRDQEGRKERLDVLGFIHALGTLVWGRNRGDVAFTELGLRLLAAL